MRSYHAKLSCEVIRQRSIRYFKTNTRQLINNHNAALNLIFDEAIERGYLTAYERPLTKNTGVESDRRAEFSHEELEAMIKYAAKFIYDGRTARTKIIRELLAIYVPFMAATGMRPGTEADSFHVPALVRHKEKYGPEGCVFWVARL